MITWISSYPKSGNTWMRAFLSAYQHQAININNFGHGFVYDDSCTIAYQSVCSLPVGWLKKDTWLLLRGAALLWINHLHQGKDCYVKTHNQMATVRGVEMFPDVLTRNAIYIVRDPRDVAPSLARHMEHEEDIDRAIYSMCNVTQAIDKKEKARNYIGRWDDHVEGWTNTGGMDRLPVRYEDMVRSPEKTFIRVLSFLKWPVVRKRLEIALELTKLSKLRAQEEQFGFNQKSEDAGFFFGKSDEIGRGRKQLTEPQVACIEKAFGSTMRKWGYLN